MAIAAANSHGQSNPGGDLAGLRRGFLSPPAEARLRCYWWWLNGDTTEETITRDLTEMSHKGFGGVLLIDADGSSQNGNREVPAGPEFGSADWVRLYLHALKVAASLHLEVTLNIASGWNLGGPDVKPAQASKLLTWSRTIVGKEGFDGPLAPPPMQNRFYQQIAVLAYPLSHGAPLPGDPGSDRAAITLLRPKSAAAETGSSMPSSERLLQDAPATSGEQDTDLTGIIDLTAKVEDSDRLKWIPPSEGQWEILRIGYTDSNAKVSTSSNAWQGLAIDYLDRAAFDTYWDHTVRPLLDVSRPYLKNTLVTLATDSWELGGTNWTGRFAEEFKRRRGYDPVRYLPVVTGRIVGDRETSDRFLIDLRRTVADLVTDHYDHFAERAMEYGLGIQCESGGPHGAPLDALETFRSSAMPQTEYWAKSNEHRTRDEDRFFTKEAASAADIYGKKFVANEGMTSIGPQWNESLSLDLKPSFDQALTEGMNRLVWHAFTSSPAKLGLPGQEYFAGTHFNPNVTWWRDAGGFTSYLNRSQFMLQQGKPVVDVLYYYGDDVPNFVRLKQDDPAKVLPGFDYDVTNSDALSHRMIATAGKLHTPEGISYRALVLPTSRIFPLAALQFAQRYVEAGGVLVGLEPLHAAGNVSATDAGEFASIKSTLWHSCEQAPDHHAAVGKGQLFCTNSAREALLSLGAHPDLEVEGDQTASIDYVHRRAGDIEIYFIRNTKPERVQTSILLRVFAKQPELFNAVTGEVQPTLLFSETADHRTRMPLTIDPYGSIFVVFHHAPEMPGVTRIVRDGAVLLDATHQNLPTDFSVQGEAGVAMLHTPDAGSYTITFSDGTTKHASVSVPKEDINIPPPWNLAFPSGWGAPASVNLDHLSSWTTSTDPGIRYFSGTATYRSRFTLTAAQLSGGQSFSLDLGEMHEIASVRINGNVRHVLWNSPYRMAADGLFRAGENTIEIDVTNLWPNRLIGDAQPTAVNHYTWTNIAKYKQDSPLLDSGLIGPVILHPIYRLPLK